MTIVWEPDRAAGAAVVRSFADPDSVRLVDNLTDAAAWVGYSAAERLVVIGADVPFIDVAAFADYMHTIYPDAVLLLLRAAPDEDIVVEAVAAGITEVVASGDPTALEAACARGRALIAQRAAEGVGRHGSPARRGEVVVVFSAKGGSGKTLLSINLALALRGAGNRSVCLVDLDLEFGDVAICLQLAPTRSIVDGVDLDLADDAAVSALVTPHPSGLDCVLAPVNPGDAERVPVSLVRALLARLRERYDYVVIDTPSQFGEHVLEAFDAADHHVLVTTPEIPALKNTRLTLDMLDLLGYRAAARSLVLNRCDPKLGVPRTDVESALHTEVAVELPATHAVPLSINAGRPLLLAEPQHAFAVALRGFTERVLTGSPAPSTTAGRARHGRKLRKRSA